jgi:hypothetical protein
METTAIRGPTSPAPPVGAGLGLGAEDGLAEGAAETNSAALAYGLADSTATGPSEGDAGAADGDAGAADGDAGAAEVEAGAAVAGCAVTGTVNDKVAGLLEPTMFVATTSTS